MPDEIASLSKASSSDSAVKNGIMFLAFVAIPNPVNGVVPTPVASFTDQLEIDAIDGHPNSAQLKVALDNGSYVGATGSKDWYESQSKAEFSASISGPAYDKLKQKVLDEYDAVHRDPLGIVGIYLDADNP